MSIGEAFVVLGIVTAVFSLYVRVRLTFFNQDCCSFVGKDKHSPYMLVTCNVGLHLPVSRKYALTPSVMKCRAF